MNTTNDNVIIKFELEQLTELAKDQEEVKRKLILAAAEKLATEKYNDNQKVIASKLQALLCKEIPARDGNPAIYAKVSKSYLYDVLPIQYKHEKKKQVKQDDTPENLFEEFLTRGVDICKDLSTVLNESLNSVQALRKSDDKKDQKLYKEIKSDWEDFVRHDTLIKNFEKLQKELSDIGQVDDFINFIKLIEAEVISIKKLADKRQKFSTATKILLKMVFTIRSHDYLAKTLTGNKYGGKWLSAIEKDEELQRFLGMIKCPKCNFNFEQWIEKAKQCERMGIAVPEIDDKFCK